MILAIARVGVSLCGGGAGATSAGVILGPGDPTLFADSSVVSVDGDAIAPHGPSPHDAGVVISGSPDTFGDGRKIVRVGDSCSCFCTVLAGAEDTFVA